MTKTFLKEINFILIQLLYIINNNAVIINVVRDENFLTSILFGTFNIICVIVSVEVVK